MNIYTDAQLTTAFYEKRNSPINKRWQVMYTPLRNAPSERTGDRELYFWAHNKIEATRIAHEYGARFLSMRVRYIYLQKGN
jgi:hypothetical protein